jgi:hypothetical protein
MSKGGIEELGIRNRTKAHLKSQVRNLKLDCRVQDAVGTDVSMSLTVQFQISDFGFEMGVRPISDFFGPVLRGSGRSGGPL